MDSLINGNDSFECFSKLNSSERNYDYKTVQYEFEKQVKLTPDKIAIEYNEEQISYQELSEKSSRLAVKLQQSGVNKNSIVALYTDRTPAMIIAIFAILKADAAYLPLDHQFPLERIIYMIENSEAKVLLTDFEKDKLPAELTDDKKDLDILKIDSLLEDHSVEVKIEQQEPDPESLAYIIYTSGSTGKPKGVQIQHQALLNFLFSMQEQPGIESNDRVLALTTISFDIAGLEIFLPLISGATLVLAGKEHSLDPVLLSKLLAEKQITLMQATPITWKMLINSGWENSTGLKVLCGGEALTLQLADQILKTGSELWNMYGPTETTIWSTVNKINAVTDQNPALGKPIANTTLYIVNEKLEVVNPGEDGELLIGGHGLALGYKNREDLTSEKFIELNLNKSETERFYRTGDLVRLTEDLELHYIGRKDTQVKVRGFRIEISEVERALLSYNPVKDAVVSVQKDDQENNYLSAFLIMEDEIELNRVELRSVLDKQLPVYMIPSMFQTVLEFPLTPNGKVDRKKLSLSSEKEEKSLGSSSENFTEVELQISKIWQDVLKLDSIGVNDNFFDIGGHSLLLAQVSEMLEKKLDIKIPIVELFQYTTIAAIAKYSKNDESKEISTNRIKSRADMQKRSLLKNRKLKKRK